MAKGKKGKGAKDKKGKKVEETPFVAEEVLTEVERTFFTLQIADIKRKILRLRAHIEGLVEANDTVAIELRGLKEERKGEAGELTNKVDEIYDNILKIRIENAKLTEAYNEDKRRSEATISDLEGKYKAMHDQLCSEIKRLNGKLNACEEFRLNRDKWVIKFNERADELAEKENEAKEVFRLMEVKSIYERELLKDELLGKLTLAGEEFTGATGSTSSSDLNLRLIRENIALQKNIDMLIMSNNEMDARMQQELELYESNKAGIPGLEERNRRLIKESQEKINVIKIISDRVNKLKQEYIAGLSYREKNLSIKEFQICARFRRRKLQQLVSQVGHKLSSMEREMQLYDYLIEQYNNERMKIEKYLEILRLTIENAIGVTNVRTLRLRSEQSLNEIKIPRRGNLLNILVGLLQTNFDVLDTEGHRASIATLAPYDKLVRFDELFKKEAPSITSLMDLCVAYVDSVAADIESRGSSTLTIAIRRDIELETNEYQPIVPAQRPYGRNYIFDVESGTSLYFSSVLEDPELMEAEERIDDDAEEQDSEVSVAPPKRASGDASAPPPAKKKPETPAPSAVDPSAEASTAAVAPSEVSGTSKLPPGTIIDVVTDDEEEELAQTDSETEETLYEDEEYDINLFY